jgi:hypothetical protein
MRYKHESKNVRNSKHKIELLESEDDDSGNETASANINGANGTDNESRDDERD